MYITWAHMGAMFTNFIVTILYSGHSLIVMYLFHVTHVPYIYSFFLYDNDIVNYTVFSRVPN